MTRFLIAFLFLALAAVLQFWFASFGVFINFIFAALIAFAFLFDILDVIFFILLAIFIMNWQPAFSWELLIFGLVPLAAYLLHQNSSYEVWAANLASIFLGLLIMYLVIAPRLFLSDWKTFFIDLVVCLVFGGIIFGALNRREAR